MIKIDSLNKNKTSILIFVFIALFAVVALRNAWLCDDAYISFRTMTNFLHGYGLQYNLSERVQSFTHPLWLFLLMIPYFFTGELYYTTIFFSLFISLAAVCFLAFKLARSKPAALAAIAILTFSKAFMDYSSSGLENPLTYLLLAIFFSVYFFSRENNERKLFLLSLIASLGLLNRMDTVLIYLPTLTYLLWQLRSIKAVVTMLKGFSPFFIWEAFSLFYYGFPFPNTAYAKLKISVSGLELIRHGIYYLQDSLKMDPLTLLIIALAIALSFFRNNRQTLPLSLGIIFYLIYVIKIGGDFMSGRFLAVPLFLAVIIISRLELSGFVSLLLILLAMDVSLLSPHCPVLSTADYGNQGITREDIVRNNGISDERAYYYQELGFLKSNSSPVPHNYVWPEDKNRQETKASAVVIGYGVIGHSALDQAPTTHIIDRYALVDPLLARLPMSPGSEWRIGHFARKIPKGYTETLRSGRNKIADKDIALYYDKLSLLTRGNLFAPQRLMTMVKMNLGYYDHLVKGSYLTEIPPVTVTIPSPENYLELSFEYMRNKQFKEGIAVAEQALKLRPNYAEAYNNLGLAYIYLGRWREGIKALNKALALKPDFELARNNLKWAKSKIRQNPK